MSTLIVSLTRLCILRWGIVHFNLIFEVGSSSFQLVCRYICRLGTNFIHTSFHRTRWLGYAFKVDNRSFQLDFPKYLSSKKQIFIHTSFHRHADRTMLLKCAIALFQLNVGVR